MQKSINKVRVAITSIVAMGAVSFAVSALAADEHANEEQCAGMV